MKFLQHWFEDIAAPVAVALLEATWLSLWFTWLGRLPPYLPHTGGSLLPFWAVFGLVLGGHAAGRLALAVGGNGQARTQPLGRREADERQLSRARLIVAGTGLAVVACAMWIVYGHGRAPWAVAWLADYALGLATLWAPVPPQLLSLLAAIYLWRRGILAGQRAISEAHDDLRRTFYTGLAGLALAVLLAAPEPGRPTPALSGAEVGWAALLFFATGLSSLAFASAQRALLQAQRIAGARITLNRYWIGASLGVVAFVLLGGMAAGWLVTPEPIRAIFAALTPVVHFVGVVLLVLFTALAAVVLIVAQIIAPAIWRLLQLFSSLSLPELPPLAPPSFAELSQQVNQFMDRVPAARALLNILAVLLLLGVIGFVFWLALDQLGRRRAQGSDEIRESIASRDLIARQLRDLLGRLWLGRGAERPFVELTGPAADPRLAIRRAYQTMLAWAAETLQEPRAPGQTPAAYEARLSAATPEAGPHLAVLTTAYLKARYSAQTPTRQEAEAAGQAVAQIRQIKIRQA